MNIDARPVAVVTGVGPGSGAATVRRFVAGHRDIVVTGNTAPLRCRALFACLAATKAAQRVDLPA